MTPPDPERAPARDERVERLVRFFEGMRPAGLDAIADHYAPGARFKDPFNDVSGVDEIRRIFAHMFDALDEPRFVVTSRVSGGDECFVAWDFTFRMRGFGGGRTHVIRGATRFVFDGSGRVALHRDYWDAAEELYEKLPVLGALMRWLKGRARA